MNCDCQTTLQSKLLERFKNEAGDATEHSIKLGGYALLLTDNTITTRSSSAVSQTARYPLKKGGTKVRTTTLTLTHSFCPFCGVAAAKAKGGAA